MLEILATLKAPTFNVCGFVSKIDGIPKWQQFLSLTLSFILVSPIKRHFTQRGVHKLLSSQVELKGHPSKTRMLLQGFCHG